MNLLGLLHSVAGVVGRRVFPVVAPPPAAHKFQQAFNSRRADLDEIPEMVFVELAMACNLRCEMCPVPKNMELMGSRARIIMKPEIFRRVLDGLSKKRHSLCLNQMGEPLLNKHVAKYVAWAKADGHRVGFYSNGTLLSRSMSDALLDAGLDHIVFSIDGATKDTFESIRIGANFEATIENIKIFLCRVQEASQALLRSSSHDHFRSDREREGSLRRPVEGVCRYPIHSPR